MKCENCKKLEQELERYRELIERMSFEEFQCVQCHDNSLLVCDFEKEFEGD